MVNSGKVLEILQTLEEFVLELQRLRGVPKEEATQQTRTQWAIRYGLQSAIQCVLDAGLNILVDGNLERPHDSKEILAALGRHGVIPAELAARIQGMAGFRNILVHRYFKVDPERVYQHLQQDLGDFAAFALHVRDWLAKGH
jgi:uncharacterized protein YutE (UPF0331/DUF86 family)